MLCSCSSGTYTSSDIPYRCFDPPSHVDVVIPFVEARNETRFYFSLRPGQRDGLARGQAELTSLFLTFFERDYGCIQRSSGNATDQRPAVYIPAPGSSQR